MCALLQVARICFVTKKPKQIHVGNVLGRSFGGYTKDKFEYKFILKSAKHSQKIIG